MMTFNDLVNDFMADEYNPEKVNNFLDAIEQMSQEQGERLQELITNRDFETLGRWLWNHSVQVMEGYATDRANYEIDSRTQWDER
jgi:hypothetical protein